NRMPGLMHCHTMQEPHGSGRLRPGEQGFDVIIGDGSLLPPGLSPGILDDLLDVRACQATGLACKGSKNALERGPVECGNVGCGGLRLGHGVTFQAMSSMPLPARSRSTASGSVWRKARRSSSD